MTWIPSYKKISANIVTWANGTDTEIAAMLEAHYNGDIDISNYWTVGDTRKIHLNSMQAPSPNSSSTWNAQDITVVIIAMNHTDLAIPINFHRKSAITVQTRECMNNNTATSGAAGHIYPNGNNSNHQDTFYKWADIYMRTYLNSIVFNAISSSNFKSAIKSSKHYKHTDYNTSTSEVVIDTLFLPSYPEVYGTTTDNYYTVTSPTEGTQFSYYTTSANRLKYGNNNGNPNNTQQAWWLSSTSSNYWSYSDESYYGYRCVWKNSNTNCGYNGRIALAPAWAM